MSILNELDLPDAGYLKDILRNELRSISNRLNLIGSANIPFSSCLQSLSLPINDNPNEGHMGNRYFPSSTLIDYLETQGNALFRDFFNTDSYLFNLQPHSGTQANQIVYEAVLESGDTVLSMSLISGGHISHKYYIQKHYNLITYGVDEAGLLNYLEIEALIRKHKPKLVILGASSYPRSIDYQRVSDICQEYGCLLLADISHTVLFIAAGKHSSPFGVADFVTFTTHKTTRGPRGGVVAYKSKWDDKIKFSLFPLLQSAPKTTEILSKVTMLLEWKRRDLVKEVEIIVAHTGAFIDVFRNRNIQLYTGGSDSHLIIIDLSNGSLSGGRLQSILESESILTNKNMVPNHNPFGKETNGLRVGTLSLASAKFALSDSVQIAEIIADAIETKTFSGSSKIKQIALKYNVQTNDNVSVDKSFEDIVSNIKAEVVTR